jgi:class 3 adenylate cyclase
MQTRIWLNDLRDGRAIRRALKTAAVVGSILVAFTQGTSIVAGDWTSSMYWQIPLMVMVPFTVSLVTNATVVGSARRANAATHSRLRDQLEAINKFPNLNPNPVLRVSFDGDLIYANTASKPITAALGLSNDEKIPQDLFQNLMVEADKEISGSFEISAGIKTYSLLPVMFKDQGFINVYGTDITAIKVLNEYPDLNPNPVMLMSSEGRLEYVNSAGAPVVRALGIEVGDLFSPDMQSRIIDLRSGSTADALEVSGEGRTYSLTPVYTREFDITHIYGDDITARIAMNKFPDQNPNPVLRITSDQAVEYANPASELTLKAIGAKVGERLSDEFFTKISAISDTGSSESIEVSADGRTFSLLVVGVFEFGFINLYGTEITAALELEKAHRDNELLLLNILPSSIADRLKSGEGLIADRFDDMSVLFADIVGFTQMSKNMNPSELVELLNNVFSLFDNIADKYNLEKIKTIGDAYMIAGGIGTYGRGHAENIADMGLEMLDLIADYRDKTGTDVQIRVGLHMGPAVAGVIGLKKFIYDVWGDTVNTASRMESHGVPSRIQVLESCTIKLAETHVFEERGEVDVKGIGLMTTYFLNGRKDSNVNDLKAESATEQTQV